MFISTSVQPARLLNVTNTSLDFKITTMGIRILVTVIIVQLCLMNSRKISAWPIVSATTRIFSGRFSSTDVRVRNRSASGLGFAVAVEEKDRAWNNASTPPMQNHKSNDDWDMLMLTIQWPQTFCMDYNDTHSGNDKCAVPPTVKNWTMHGLWPSKNGGMGPSFCNNTWKFDLQKISDLVPQLNASWPDYLISEAYDSLWSHEWTKHGTCASAVPALYGMHNYFQTTLGLKSQFDILSMLDTAGVMPSQNQSYAYDTIFTAVKSKVGYDPILTCLYDPTLQTIYLSQVELCMDKQFNLIDCVATKSRTPRNLRDENCSHDKNIFYPPLTH